jgi:hypothetical protein
MILTNLHFSGCSFVAGTSMHVSTKEKGELTIPEKLSYNFHTLLSKKLNVPNTNEAEPGGSNERAIRVIFDKARNNNVEGTLFIFGLTELYRTEKFNNHLNQIINWKYESFFEFDDPIKFDINLIPINNRLLKEFSKADAESIVDYAKTEFLFFKNRKYEYDKLTQSLHTLNAYVESKGAKLLIFSAMCSMIDKTNLDGLNFIEFPDGSLEWRKYIRSYDAHYAGTHPSIDDQPIFTSILFKYIKEFI